MRRAGTTTSTNQRRRRRRRRHCRHYHYRHFHHHHTTTTTTTTTTTQCRQYLGAHRDVAGGVDLEGVKSEVASLVEEYRYTLDLNKG